MTFARGDVAVLARRQDVERVRAHTPAGVAVIGVDEPADVAAPADLVLLGRDVRVDGDWLDALRAAAGDDGTVATVDAVVVAGEAPVPPLSELRPRAQAPVWACTLVTRAALDLAGPLDAGFADRCSAAGLLHVVAGEVVVRGPEPT